MTSAKIPAKPGKDTIYVDVDDEITAIIDKVEAAKQKIVALVLPKRATVLQSVVNMRLLKRSADKADKNVVLITAEEALIPLAGAVGLHVAKSLQSKPEVPLAPTPLAAKKPAAKTEEIEEPIDDTPNDKLDYHRSVGELAAAGEEPETVELEDDDAPEETPEDKPAKHKAPKNKALKVPNFDRFRLMLIGGIGLAVLLVVFIILALFVLPKATITVSTGSLPVTANLDVTASDAAKKLDEKTGAIPATVETTKQTDTKTVTATGQQNNGHKATGTITMSAEKCSGNPFVAPSDVPAGTGVTSGGNTYITQSATSFHGSGTSGSCYTYDADSSTDVTAQKGGADYNASNATFAVSGRSDVSATGSASGGTDDIRTVVSQADLDKAANSLTDSNNDGFVKDFEDELAGKGLYVFVSTLKASSPKQTADPALGEAASSTSVTSTITYTVLAVKKTDLTKLITDALNKQIDKSTQTLSNSDVLAGAAITVTNQPSTGKAKLSIAENTTAVPIIDVAKIKQQASGQKVGDIKSLVENLPGVKSVDVHLSPFWISKAPKAGKITVVQKQIQSGS